MAAIAVVGLSSCHYRNSRHVSGNGRVTAEQRTVTGFTGIETRGDIDIIVSQGSFNVRVEADQNLLQYIETSVTDGRLVVRFRDHLSIYNDDDVKVYVSAPELNYFATSGSGNINGRGKIADKTRMGVKVAGSGDVELQLDCPEIKTETYGSGDISLKGEARNVSCELSGSGDLKAADLKAEAVKISVHGSGDTEIFASESLDAEIFGSGDVHYKGDPKISSSIHGSGELSKMD